METLSPVTVFVLSRDLKNCKKFTKEDLPFVDKIIVLKIDNNTQLILLAGEEIELFEEMIQLAKQRPHETLEDTIKRLVIEDMELFIGPHSEEKNIPN